MSDQDKTGLDEILKDIRENLPALNPNTLSRYAVHLSAHLATMGEAWAKAELAYNQKWDTLRMNTDTDGQAEKRSKATQEYYLSRLLGLQLKSVTQTIQSLKKRLKVLEDEAHGLY